MSDFKHIMKHYAGYLCIMLFATLSGCKKPYNPPVIASSPNYLVVEGVINSGADSTFITLSRTVNIGAKGAVSPVIGAVLTIQGDQNTSYPLQEIAAGKYACAGLNLDVTHNYRLSIKAGTGQYISDYVPVVTSPPIDTIAYPIQSNGVSITVSTHGTSNATKYYRWDYRETWIFHSFYTSGYVSNGDTVIERKFPSQEVNQCWGNDTSSTISLATSAGLSKNVISNAPITFIPSTSEKVGSEYSIIVNQYALTADAYTFWVNLKKNTEGLGGIFDPQPSQINGNIHSVTNPAEPVIGYISVGTVTSKRIFIKSQQLPGWIPKLPYTDCPLDTLYLQYLPPGATVSVNQEDQYFNYKKDGGSQVSQIPVGAIIIIPKIGPEYIIGHSGSSPECVDCTLRGTNKQPAFWQ